MKIIDTHDMESLVKIINYASFKLFKMICKITSLNEA